MARACNSPSPPIVRNCGRARHCLWTRRSAKCPARMLHVVLVEPEIPPNTGNVGRLCLATDSHLHLVKPLGFDIDDRAVRRAGLDYWDQVKVTVWDSLDALFASQPAGTRNYFLTTKCERPYYEAQFRTCDFLIFG